jgi:hypothetical protein
VSLHDALEGDLISAGDELFQQPAADGSGEEQGSHVSLDRIQWVCLSPTTDGRGSDDRTEPVELPAGPGFDPEILGSMFQGMDAVGRWVGKFGNSGDRWVNWAAAPMISTLRILADVGPAP